MENKDSTISITDLLIIFKKYFLVIMVTSVITTVAAYVICNYFIEKKYSATAVFYLENKNMASGDRTTVTTEEINSAQRLVQNAISVLRSMDSIPARVIEKHGLRGYTVNSFKKTINFSNEPNTTVLSISVTMKEKNLVVSVLQSYSDICIEEFERVINSGSIKEVNAASSNGNPVYPIPHNFLMIGSIIGFVGSYFAAFIKEILDTKVKSEDDLFTIYNIPVFAEILSFNSKSKSSYSSYSYE
ncbi:MAG: hypothetical protein LBR74_04365 [Eubacterium sp.]|jgi:capsular polysaccharide biosynthesis protein|nr:hypothetical protein [Eubacterium sp.]